jgi:intracellular septation protein
MTLQVVIEKIVNGKVAKMLFISWCLLIPLGAITLLLRDPIFLQWKFSIIHWLLGGMLAFSQFLNGQSFLKTMLISVGPQLESVPEFAWRKVTYFMAIAFVAIGTINLYFIYFSDIETWVNFKLFGVTILNMAIMSVSLFYLFSHSSETDKT